MIHQIKNIIFVQDIHHIRQAEAVQLGIGLGGGDMVAEISTGLLAFSTEKNSVGGLSLLL